MSRSRAGGFSERNAEGACHFVQSHPEGAVVSIVVQPGARKTVLAGLYEGAVKIKVCAPPVEGAANKECLRFLAALVERPRTGWCSCAGTEAESNWF